jgi:hypothetical protein
MLTACLWVVPAACAYYLLLVCLSRLVPLFGLCIDACGLIYWVMMGFKLWIVGFLKTRL